MIFLAKIHSHRVFLFVILLIFLPILNWLAVRDGYIEPSVAALMFLIVMGGFINPWAPFAVAITLGGYSVMLGSGFERFLWTPLSCVLIAIATVALRFDVETSLAEKQREIDRTKEARAVFALTFDLNQLRFIHDQLDALVGDGWETVEYGQKRQLINIAANGLAVLLSKWDSIHQLYLEGQGVFQKGDKP